MPNATLDTWIQNEFHWLHQHPELSEEEIETTAHLKSVLAEHGITPLPIPLRTGLVVEIGQGSNLIALRSDIDALPIKEESNLPYASLYQGRMHACGHDFHTATMLAAAVQLKAIETALPGRVRVIFQPAEERPGGAQHVIDAGALEGVQEIYGIHVTPSLEVGTLGLREGATHAAVDRFKISFHGRGTHAAHPELGDDTIVAASHFVAATQSIVSRNSSAFATNLISITHFEGGSTWNVLPENVTLEGTIRSLSAENRSLLKRRLVEVGEGIAKSFNVTFSIDWVFGIPATHHDPVLTAWVGEVAKEAGFTVTQAPFSLGGEDFSLYEEQIPGSFVMVGSGLSKPLHNPGFIADPKAIFPTSKLMVTVARRALERLQ